MRTQTQETITAITEYLRNKHGDVKDEWKVLLSLFADNLELYADCKDAVKRYGIYDPNSGRKNPLLATMKDTQATLLKQVQHLGLSPYAVSKIKQDDTDDTEDFLSNLIS